MDRVEAVVAVEHLDRMLIGIAMPTQHLNRQAIGARAVFGWPGLDDRRQEIQQYLCASALGLVRSSAHVVSQLCTKQTQAIGTFGIGLLCQQHASHIRMLNDPHGRRERIPGRR
ncbi:hypothetical protein D3C75_901920 [compost metagenome]